MTDKQIQTIQVVGLLASPFVAGGLILAVLMVPYVGPVIVLGGMMACGLAKWWV